MVAASTRLGVCCIFCSPEFKRIQVGNLREHLVPSQFHWISVIIQGVRSETALC